MARVRLGPDTIRAILEEGGWPCHRIADDTFRSLFQGKNASFPFFVRIDPAGFVVFAIVPYLRSPSDAAIAGKLYARLLELNQSLLMAKFSIDDDLDVVLSVEYAVAELDRSEFDDALDVLSYYADRHYDELRKLCAGSDAIGRTGV
ncbi:YbjN domain-containing protein [Sandaracinus amylolyticus]|uniref:YbjN domain-containing protein n=1 Tax=Sandaracinus amylolyticus TaxID=927083 RepID=A0A0F6SFS0_9BACT|nr:YbjN domain-containing protein [Sandaracinus amylolyticus]AKF07429.1 hypothetical protein DB32_004578 [Sandaracinus amylolyticus]